MVKKISNLFLAGLRSFLRIGIPLLLIGITCIIINIYDPALLNSIIDAIRHHPTSYLLFRWGALISFILCWPLIVAKIGQHLEATPQQILQWRNEIWQIAVWLIVIEMLVCENLVGKVLHLLGGF
jgi:hypothetical protein